MNSLWGWVGFNVVVLAILALDLGVLHRRAVKVSLKEAATWSAVWVALSLCFAFAVFETMGKESGLEFLTGYLIEYALSVDNIFVFVLIFSYFNVPEKYQHRVLFWGIIGALVLRGVMIVAGSALVTRFSWTLYFFGAFLVVTGVRMALQKDETAYNPERDPVLRLSRRLIPVTAEYSGDKFYLRHGFHPRDLCCYTRSLHRLYLEHLRRAWLAPALLSARQRGGQVRVLEAWTVARSHLHRREDVGRALRPYSHPRSPRRGRRRPRSIDPGFAQVAAAGALKPSCGVTHHTGTPSFLVFAFLSIHIRDSA